MIYIKFDEPQKKKKSKYDKIILNIIKNLLFFLPKANPDYEVKIDLVSTWYLEFSDRESEPTREIGLDNFGNVILKMPYKKNVGYWTDNNLVFDDFFNAFNPQVITDLDFMSKWSCIT